MSAAGGFCVGYGLTIATQVPIPGAMRATSTEAPDIDVDYGAPPHWAERQAWGPYRVADADLFDFTMAGVARFTCRHRRQITITPDDRADESDIAAMLVATALPALLWARGEIVLHAAAARAADASHGWLAAGASGSGKSTRLLSAVQHGASAIADDSVRLRLVDGEVLASGLPGGTFVRRAGENDRRDFQAFADGRQLRECPVDTLLLCPDEVQAGADRKVNGLTALLRHRHRPRIAQLLRTEPVLLSPLAAIAATLRIAPIRH